MGFFKSIAKVTTTGLGLDKVADFVGDKLLGGDAADAANDAARVQAASADKAIALQRESRDLAREDLDEFKGFGSEQINPLTNLLTSQGQADYLQNNPLLDLSLEAVNDATVNNQAARGKLGSGGTLLALQDNYTRTAMPLLQNQQNQLFNAVNLGQSSAAGQANTTLATGNALTDLTTQQGNAVASGIVGAAGAKQAGINNLLNLGGQLGGSYLGAA